MAFTGLTGSRALPTWEAFPFIAEINEAIDFIHGDVGLTGTFGLTGAGITGLAGLTANFGYSGVTVGFTASTSTDGNYACTVLDRPDRTQVAQVTYDDVGIPGAVIIFIGTDLLNKPTVDMTSVRNTNIARSSAQTGGAGYIPLMVLLRFNKSLAPTTGAYTALRRLESTEGAETYTVSGSIGGLSIALDKDISSRSSAFRAGYGMQLYAQISSWRNLDIATDFQFVVSGPTGGTGAGGPAAALSPVFSVTNDVVLVQSTVKDGAGVTLDANNTTGVYTAVVYPNFDHGPGGTGDSNVVVATFKVTGGKNAAGAYSVDVFEQDGTPLDTAGHRQGLNVSVEQVDDEEATVTLFYDLNAGDTGTASARDASCYTSGTVTVTDDLSRTLNLPFKVFALSNPELTLSYSVSSTSDLYYVNGENGIHSHLSAYGATGVSFTVGGLSGNWLNSTLLYTGVTLGSLSVVNSGTGAVDVSGSNCSISTSLKLVYSKTFAAPGLTASVLYDNLNVNLTENGRQFPSVIKYIANPSRHSLSEGDVQFYVFPATTVDSATDIKDPTGNPYNSTVEYGVGLTAGYQVAYYPGFDYNDESTPGDSTSMFEVLTFTLKGGKTPGGTGAYSAVVQDFAHDDDYDGAPGLTGTATVTGNTVAVKVSGLSGSRFDNEVIDGDEGLQFTVVVTDVFGVATRLKVQAIALARPSATFVYSDDVFGTQLRDFPYTRGWSLPRGSTGSALNFTNGGVLTTSKPIVQGSTGGYAVGTTAFGLSGCTGLGSYYFTGVTTTTSLTDFALGLNNAHADVALSVGELAADINVGVVENARLFTDILPTNVTFYIYPQLQVTDVENSTDESVALVTNGSYYPVVYYPGHDTVVEGMFKVASFKVKGGLLEGDLYPEITASATGPSGSVTVVYGTTGDAENDGAYTATVYYGSTGASRDITGIDAMASSVVLTVTCGFRAIDYEEFSRTEPGSEESKTDATTEALAEFAAATASVTKAVTFHVLALANPSATFAYNTTTSFKRKYQCVYARPTDHDQTISDFTVGTATFNGLLQELASAGTTDSVLTVTNEDADGVILEKDVPDGNNVTLEFKAGGNPSYTRYEDINVKVHENGRCFAGVITNGSNDAGNVQFYVYPALTVVTSTAGKVSATCLPHHPVAMHTTYGLGTYVLKGRATNISRCNPDAYAPFSIVSDTTTAATAITVLSDSEDTSDSDEDVYKHPSVISFAVHAPVDNDDDDASPPSRCHHMNFELSGITGAMRDPAPGSTTFAHFRVKATVKSIDEDGNVSESESESESDSESETKAEEAAESAESHAEVTANDAVLLVYADLKPLRESFEAYENQVLGDSQEEKAEADTFAGATTLYADVALTDGSVLFPYNALVAGGFLAYSECGSSHPRFCIEEGLTGSSFAAGGTGDVTVLTHNLASAIRTQGPASSLRLVFHDGADAARCVEYTLLYPFVYISDVGVSGTEDDDDFVNGVTGCNNTTVYSFPIVTANPANVVKAVLYQLGVGGTGGGDPVTALDGIPASDTDGNEHISVTTSLLNYTREHNEAAANPLYDYRIELTVREAFVPNELVLLQDAAVTLTVEGTNDFTAEQRFTLVDRTYATNGVTGGNATNVHMTNYNKDDRGVTMAGSDTLVDGTPVEDYYTGSVGGVSGSVLPAYNVVAYASGGLFDLGSSHLTSRDTYVLDISEGLTGATTWSDVSEYYEGGTRKKSSGTLGVEFYAAGSTESLGSVLFVQLKCGRVVVTNADDLCLSRVVAIATTQGSGVSWDELSSSDAKYVLTVLHATSHVSEEQDNPVTTGATAGATGPEQDEPETLTNIVVHADKYSIWLTRATKITDFIFGHYAPGLTGNDILAHEIPDATRLGICNGTVTFEGSNSIAEDNVKVVYSLRARLEDPGLASAFEHLTVGDPAKSFTEFYGVINDKPWMELATNVVYTSRTDISSCEPVTIGALKQLLYGPAGVTVGTGEGGLRISPGDHTLASDFDVRAWPERLWPFGCEQQSWRFPGYTLRYRLYLQTPARLRSDYFTLCHSKSEVFFANKTLPGFDITGPVTSDSTFDYFSVYFKATAIQIKQGVFSGVSIRRPETASQYLSDTGVQGAYIQRHAIRDNQVDEVSKYFASYDVGVSKAFDNSGLTGATFETRTLTTFDTLARSSVGTSTEFIVVGAGLTFQDGNPATITFPTACKEIPIITLPASKRLTKVNGAKVTGYLYITDTTTTGFSIEVLDRNEATFTETLTGTIDYTYKIPNPY